MPFVPSCMFICVRECFAGETREGARGRGAKVGGEHWGIRSTISGHLRASYCQWRDSDIGGSPANCLREIALFVGISLVKFLG